MLDFLIEHRVPILVSIIVLLVIATFSVIIYFSFISPLFSGSFHFGRSEFSLSDYRKSMNIEENQRIIRISMKKKKKKSLSAKHSGKSNKKSSNPPQYSSLLIFLHGFGDSGYGLLPIIEEYLRKFPNSLCLLPNAPISPVSAQSGYPISNWHDFTWESLRNPLKFLEKAAANHQKAKGKNEEEIPFKGLSASIQWIHQIMQEEIENHTISSSQSIYLAGFSQGGAIALAAGYQFSQPLGGILAFSSYFPYFSQQQYESILYSSSSSSSSSSISSSPNFSTPSALFHGRRDNVLPIELSISSESLLKSMNYSIQRYDYDELAHSMNQEEIIQMNEILEEWMKKNKDNKKEIKGIRKYQPQEEEDDEEEEETEEEKEEMVQPNRRGKSRSKSKTK